jgi:hypothetical protein
MNKIELAKTSVDWGIQIVRIDFNIKDVEKQLKNQFINAYLNGNPTDIAYVPVFQPIQSALTNTPNQGPQIVSQHTIIINQMERQTTSNMILNPAKLETSDPLKYVPYVALPEETFAKSSSVDPSSKMTLISN